jgi:hypothetical protein
MARKKSEPKFSYELTASGKSFLKKRLFNDPVWIFYVNEDESFKTLYPAMAERYSRLRKGYKAVEIFRNETKEEAFNRVLNLKSGVK